MSFSLFSEEVREVAENIGKFYLQKNNGDYVATETAILNLRISKIEIREDGSVAINTARPGLLIGKMGRTIGELIEHLHQKVLVIEDRETINDYLTPHPNYEELLNDDDIMGFDIFDDCGSLDDRDDLSRSPKCEEPLKDEFGE